MFGKCGDTWMAERIWAAILADLIYAVKKKIPDGGAVPRRFPGLFVVADTFPGCWKPFPVDCECFYCESRSEIVWEPLTGHISEARAWSHDRSRKRLQVRADQLDHTKMLSDAKM